MTQALPAALDPTRRLAFISEVITRLSGDLGITIRYVTWPGDELADWHSAARTFYIASDATLDQQVWAFMDLLLLLVVGPDACNAAHRMPILHSVPQPGDNPDIDLTKQPI
jgi:hypothetical protein